MEWINWYKFFVKRDLKLNHMVRFDYLINDIITVVYLGRPTVKEGKQGIACKLYYRTRIGKPVEHTRTILDKGSKQGNACKLNKKNRMRKYECKFFDNDRCYTLKRLLSTQSHDPKIDTFYERYKIITNTKRLTRNYLIERKKYHLSTELEQGLACSNPLTEGIQYLTSETMHNPVKYG